MNSPQPIICLFACFAIGFSAAYSFADDLPPGYVQGDVISYSYVPIKTWTLSEGYGKLPYLIEYNLMKHKDDWLPLETHHEENIRRIDMASQWSTVIMLYPRHDYYHDEIINLMIRCFHHRQLIELGEYADLGVPDPFPRLTHILETLWTNRDNPLPVTPEGQTATGRQLINNILMVGLGDEEFCSLGTTGLYQVFQEFHDHVKYRVMDGGEQPFSHIKGWYNMIHYRLGCHAASQNDIDNYGRQPLPSNTEFIGVDTYHYWSFPYSDDPINMTPSQRQANAQSWQNIITKYYPSGLSVSPCDQWAPECRNDTHAMIGAINLAGATNAMMFFIGNSSAVRGSCYTTPIETLDAYYDNLKAGPWVGLSWWVFGDWDDVMEGGINYMDKTLIHYTPEHPEGIPYTQAQLDAFHDAYFAHKMRLFNDITQNQLVTPVITEVSPDPDAAFFDQEYTKQLTLETGSPPPSWSVIQGPAGTQVDGNGLVSGWTPSVADLGQIFTFEVRAGSYMGQDYETWTARVKSLADFDDDNDADLEDFGYLQACLSGSGIQYKMGCEKADLHPQSNPDGDVDQDDFDVFISCMGGANKPPRC